MYVYIIYIFEYLPVCLITFVFLFVFVHITKKPGKQTRPAGADATHLCQLQPSTPKALGVVELFLGVFGLCRVTWGYAGI